MPKLNEQAVKRKFTEETLSNFLEYIVLGHHNTAYFSAYDIIKYIHREFGILPSAGTVYTTLYSMERRELIKGTSQDNHKRVYRVTDNGRFVFKVATSKGYVMKLINRIFSDTIDLP